VGRLLRRWADRIDPANAPRKSGYSYTVERGTPQRRNPNGIAVHIDGTGCPFWIIPADRGRAWTEAATDWRSPQQKLHDVFQQFGDAVDDAMRPAVEAFSNVPKRATGGPVLPPQPMPYDPAADGPIIRLREDR
jgi:hypothetical protein